MTFSRHLLALVRFSIAANVALGLVVGVAFLIYGDTTANIDLTLDGWDADAVGRVSEALDRAQGNPDPMMAFASTEEDLADLVAAGLAFRINRFDMTLPQGALESKMEITVPESERGSFDWPSVLLAMEASADVTIDDLLDPFLMTDMQAAVAMGVLRPEGDNYVMEAEYKQGLLTVNGAPMPIPIPGM